MAKIDWNSSSNFIFNQVRAFNPSPICFTMLNNEPFKIYECKVVDMAGEPGTILSLDKELIVACKDKAISLLSIQKAGGKQMNVVDFLRGSKLSVGDKLGV